MKVAARMITVTMATSMVGEPEFDNGSSTPLLRFDNTDVADHRLTVAECEASLYQVGTWVKDD